jgi:hypothetical protein
MTVMTPLPKTASKSFRLSQMYELICFDKQLQTTTIENKRLTTESF